MTINIQYFTEDGAIQSNQPLCPAASSAAFVNSIALWTGGWGRTTPLSQSIAKHKPFPWPCSSKLYSFSDHSFLMTRGSLSHGFASIMAFVNSFTPDIEFAIGPRLDEIDSCP